MEQFIMENTYFMKNRKANLDLRSSLMFGNWKMGVEWQPLLVSTIKPMQIKKQYIQF
jgi:hypothetical protein